MQDNIEKTLTDTLQKEDAEMLNVGKDNIENELAQDNIESDLMLAQSKVEELNDAWLRARADLENMRRRSQEDVTQAQKYSINKFATDLLSIKDSLEMALKDESGQIDSLKNGVELTLKQLCGVFERYHVAEIEPMGEKLDPHKHQAITTQPSDTELNTVVAVMQKGYQLHDRVLRPAMVIVSSGVPKAAE